MLVNAEGMFVWDWVKDPPEQRKGSTCPDCGSLLIARQCEHKVSHWAHAPRSRTSMEGCDWEETQWHLKWKQALYDYRPQSRAVEVPLEVAGNKYRIDAVVYADSNKVLDSRACLYEFVHSLSDRYVSKHFALSTLNVGVCWVLDGEVFAAERRKPVAGGGYKNMLKPRARDLVESLGPAANVVIHMPYSDRFFAPWAKNPSIWYPKNNQFVLMDAWNAAKQKAWGLKRA